MRKTKGSPKNSWKCVYVILFSDSSVKIGVSKDFDARIKIHKQNTHLEEIKVYTTEKCSNAFEIERTAKKHFAQKIMFGSEWFNVSFEEAVAYVENTFLKIAKFEDTTEEERKKADEFSLALKTEIKKTEKQLNSGWGKHLEALQKNNKLLEQKREMLKESIKNTERAIDTGIHSQNMLKYTLWYFEETCKENMMWSEFQKFKKDYLRIERQISNSQRQRP